jgi:gamma-glutamyltranspeptidase/glutathione hydrolase
MRRPTIVGEAMVATSHPLATRAGVRALERGGNAVDAALAAAAMLCVAECGFTGIGGDAFAQVWFDGRLHGLNGSGRSPAELDGTTVDRYGPRSVTVPGSVRAWADLADRFGRLGLDGCLADAIDAGERGIAATERVAIGWNATPRAPWPAPAQGELYTLPDLAGSLRAIADGGAEAFYHGRIAAQIAAACWLTEEDLARHEGEWVEPLRLAYRGAEVCELPPNGQGAAALIALALAEGLPETLHSRIEAMKLALADAYGWFSDAPFPAFLLDPEHLAGRRALVSAERALLPEASVQPAGGTTYLCTVDAERNAVSLIQSTYEHFGSGVLAADTGIVLQNRGAGFVETDGHPNRLEPRKRPFHTIIPGMLLRDGALWGPFGVMGGPMQAQGHLQVVQALVDGGLDPQRALDEPRFRVEDDWSVALEAGLWVEAPELRGLGHVVQLDESERGFGVGQCILAEGSSLVGGSDGRGDGHAAGF